MPRTYAVAVIGWIGVALVLSAYLLVNMKVIEVDTVIYPVMNLVGSIFVMVSSLSRRDLQPVVLNFVWAGAAAAVLVSMFF